MVSTTVLAIILYTSFFPIAFNVLSGVRTVPMTYINAVRTMGGSRYQIIRDVLLPGAMPHIATGTRLSIGFAWRGARKYRLSAGQPDLVTTGALRLVERLVGTLHPVTSRFTGA